MIDEDEALMKAATSKPRSLVKLSDTRWNVLSLVLRRFHSLNPALRLLCEKLQKVSIDNSKVCLVIVALSSIQPIFSFHCSDCRKNCFVNCGMKLINQISGNK